VTSSRELLLCCRFSVFYCILAPQHAGWNAGLETAMLLLLVSRSDIIVASSVVGAPEGHECCRAQKPTRARCHSSLPWSICSFGYFSDTSQSCALSKLVFMLYQAMSHLI